MFTTPFKTAAIATIAVIAAHATVAALSVASLQTTAKHAMLPIVKAEPITVVAKALPIIKAEAIVVYAKPQRTVNTAAKASPGGV